MPTRARRPASTPPATSPTVVLRPATRPDPERRRQLVAWLAELLERAERRRAGRGKQE